MLTLGHVLSCPLSFVDKVTSCKYQSKILTLSGLEPNTFRPRSENNTTRPQGLVDISVSSDDFKYNMQVTSNVADKSDG